MDTPMPPDLFYSGMSARQRDAIQAADAYVRQNITDRSTDPDNPWLLAAVALHLISAGGSKGFSNDHLVARMHTMISIGIPDPFSVLDDDDPRRPSSP